MHANSFCTHDGSFARSVPEELSVREEYETVGVEGGGATGTDGGVGGDGNVVVVTGDDVETVGGASICGCGSGRSWAMSPTNKALCALSCWLGSLGYNSSVTKDTDVTTTIPVAASLSLTHRILLFVCVNTHARPCLEGTFASPPLLSVEVLDQLDQFRRYLEVAYARVEVLEHVRQCRHRDEHNRVRVTRVLHGSCLELFRHRMCTGRL